MATPWTCVTYRPWRSLENSQTCLIHHSVVLHFLTSQKAGAFESNLIRPPRGKIATPHHCRRVIPISPPITYCDYTLTSPLSTLDKAAVPLLALTIIWHPDRARMGEQAIGAAAGDAIALSRYAPLFMHAGGEGLALGYGGLSRQPCALCSAPKARSA
jgi:hypothetical protein